MERTPIKSSLISSIGYDAASKTLEVEFAKGGIYQYAGVEPEHHAALVGADSVGKHFGANIRGKFKHFKVVEAHSENSEES